VYVMAGGSSRQIIQGFLLAGLAPKREGKKLVSVSAKPNQEDLLFLKQLLEAGKIVSVVDRCYPLSEAAEALRYLGGGHASGKVVITMV